MTWLNRLFDVKKPIIAMLHLAALPGDPLFRHNDSMGDVVEKAKRDLIALQNGGVDGILVSNEFSLPYQRKMDFVTPAAMARVIGELKSIVRLPLGVDCISDGLAAIELAAAVEADFVRGTFSGVYVGDGGFYDNDFSMLMRRKAALHMDDLKMVYFLNPESDQNLDLRPLTEIAKSLLFKANPAGFCISACAAGQDVNDELIQSVKSVSGDVPVFCNTGCRAETICRKLTYADGAMVGTTFKKDGVFSAPVDQTRVEAFMKVVRDYRATL